MGLTCAQLLQSEWKVFKACGIKEEALIINGTTKLS
jgi:hypothetical protein